MDVGDRVEVVDTGIVKIGTRGKVIAVGPIRGYPNSIAVTVRFIGPVAASCVAGNGHNFRIFHDGQLRVLDPIEVLAELASKQRRRR